METKAIMGPLSPDLLLRAYAMGVFPMARNRHDPRLYWVDPEERGILPLGEFHISKSLRKTLKRGDFQVRVNSAFSAVIEGCAEPAPGRAETWINAEILRLFQELHRVGLAHSVESWSNGHLVGGLYGLSIGAAFFGESMFSRQTDASKVALVHLVARLKRGGYRLLDTQFVTDHLKQFGAVEIPRRDYIALLADAVENRARFQPETEVPWDEALAPYFI